MVMMMIAMTSDSSTGGRCSNQAVHVASRPIRRFELSAVVGAGAVCLKSLRTAPPVFRMTAAELRPNSIENLNC